MEDLVTITRLLGETLKQQGIVQYRMESQHMCVNPRNRRTVEELEGMASCDLEVFTIVEIDVISFSVNRIKPIGITWSTKFNGVVDIISVADYAYTLEEVFSLKPLDISKYYEGYIKNRTKKKVQYGSLLPPSIRNNILSMNQVYKHYTGETHPRADKLISAYFLNEGR